MNRHYLEMIAAVLLGWGIERVAMLPAMLVAMLLRHDEYSGSVGEPVAA